MQSGHQFGVAVLQGEELGLQIHLTDGAERNRSHAVLLQDTTSEMEPGGPWITADLLISSHHANLLGYIKVEQPFRTQRMFDGIKQVLKSSYS